MAKPIAEITIDLVAAFTFLKKSCNAEARATRMVMRHPEIRHNAILDDNVLAGQHDSIEKSETR
jgi:hypothetical protein